MRASTTLITWLVGKFANESYLCRLVKRQYLIIIFEQYRTFGLYLACKFMLLFFIPLCCRGIAVLGFLNKRKHVSNSLVKVFH